MNREKFEKVESLLSEARKNLNEAMTGKELEDFEDREAYLDEFNRVCDVFGVSVELEEDADKDDVYSEWNDMVNMSASDLQKWSKNPCSRQASQKPVTVMKRNLRLLERNKSEWTSNDVEDAQRTVSFINRMRPNRPDSPREGPHGCPSEWAISLLNWAFNPFDSVPTPSSEVKDDLEAVEQVTLSSELSENTPSVLFKEERAADEAFESVKEVEVVMSGRKVSMYTEELSESRQASQVVHGDQEKHLGSDGSDEDSSVRVPPVAIHKVEGGEQVEVSEDVEAVLDELWDDKSEE